MVALESQSKTLPFGGHYTFFCQIFGLQIEMPYNLPVYFKFLSRSNPTFSICEQLLYSEQIKPLSGIKNCMNRLDLRRVSCVPGSVCNSNVFFMIFGYSCLSGLIPCHPASCSNIVISPIQNNSSYSSIK